MSVLKSQRKESSIKFLDTAYNLELHTLKCCMKLPKRYTFFIGTELSHLASEVHNHCKAANSIYPTNEHEAQMRRDHLIEANNCLQALIGKCSVLMELQHGLSEHALEHWADLMIDEGRLIAGAKKSDKARFKF